MKPTAEENKRTKPALDGLDELIIRLNQSRLDGKILVGIGTFEKALRLVVRAIKEK